jgi:hypothetical protein
VDIRFLTPLGAAFALTALLPLAVLVYRERRARRLRTALALAQPPHRAHLPLALALVAISAIVALAAMQPVIERTRTVHERTDAEVFVVFDVSRSMLAAAKPGSPTRLERAQAIAETLRAGLPEVPIGVLSMTDRILPHLFPTIDEKVFASTVENAIGIERPPPALFFSTRATSLDTLEDIPPRDFFSPAARKRLLVVLTDGESRPLAADLRSAYSKGRPIDTLLVHVWSSGERIYETGVAERGYRPDRTSESMLASVATAVGGHAFDEGQLDEVREAARSALGTGPTRERVIEGDRQALMPWVTLAAFLPLGFALRRRNV